MSAKIEFLPNRLPKAKGAPDPESEPDFIETHGDELAIFVLRRSGDAQAWFSEDIHTPEGWDLIRDFLKQAEIGLAKLRDTTGDK